jgi:hypothetical protein
MEKRAEMSGFEHGFAGQETVGPAGAMAWAFLKWWRME